MAARSRRTQEGVMTGRAATIRVGKARAGVHGRLSGAMGVLARIARKAAPMLSLRVKPARWGAECEYLVTDFHDKLHSIPAGAYRHRALGTVRRRRGP